VAVEGAALDRLDRALPDGRPGRNVLHSAQRRRSADERVGGDLEARRDGTTEIRPFGTDHIEIRRSAEVDHDRRRAVPFARGERVHDPIGADLAVVAIKLGNARYGKKDYVGAVIHYTRAIELQPDSARALRNRGMARKRLEDMRGATDDFSQALRLDPALSDARQLRRFVAEQRRQATSSVTPAGTWKGQYGYGIAYTDERRALRLKFTWKLALRGTELSGRSREQKSFGPGNAKFLDATWKGTYDAGTRKGVLMKTYVREDARSSPVRWTFRLAEDGKSLSGTWVMLDEKGYPKSARGTFQAKR